MAVRSPALILGYGTGLSALLFAFSFTGGTLYGYQKDPTVDEVSRKEYMRKNRRRPIEQTVNELGESARTYPRNTFLEVLEANRMCRCPRARVRAAESTAHQGGVRH